MAKNKSSVKERVQKFGSNLSNMVMPNIGAFIAWGLIAALFMNTGWFPNKDLAKMITPMVTYLLPLLIGFTGGDMLYGHRGGVVGAIATMGVIVGAKIPMFIGAMIMGPLGGWLMKKFDKKVQPKIKQGFEMLVNNFSAGILGMLLAIIGFYAIGPVVVFLSGILSVGVDWMIQRHLIPLANLIIDPAKVLFLNNAINQGILTPLGIQQSAQAGKSILFLLEPDPGPGLGVLLAYWLFGHGTAKESAPAAMIIHFFGGIHEIYFPYVLMKPALLLSVALGGMTGTTIFSLFNVGLKASPSPGSIISILLMTPKGANNYIGILLGVAAATLVSFLVSAVILKRSKNDVSLEEGKAKMNGDSDSSDEEPAVNGQDLVNSDKDIKHIIFACDAGMGSSAMGASILRDKVKKAGLNISVTNTAISNLKPENNLMVITQKELAERAAKKAPNAYRVAVDNFMDSKPYDEIVSGLRTKEVTKEDKPAATTEAKPATKAKTTVDPLKGLDLAKVKDLVLLHHDQMVGSSTMAASELRGLVKKNGKKDIKVEKLEPGEVNDDASTLIIATKETSRRAKLGYNDVQVLTVNDLVDSMDIYKKLISELK